MINVTVWNEFCHEKESDEVRKVYPNGIHSVIADFLKTDEEISVRTATLDMPECGLTDEVINNTDVMLWWGHMKHHEVPDETAKKVADAVLRGMGIIFLHSAHFSKPFKLLMGTSCSLGWREDGDFERVWVTAPSHPIVQGIGKYFELEHEETYTEFFDIPQPDELILNGWYEGGETFRSGCCYNRGLGRVFYFQPGHETFPTFYNSAVQTIIKNAVHWAAPTKKIDEIVCPNVEKIKR
jgi:trehalose utilization protein